MKKVLVLGGGYASLSFLKHFPQSYFNQAEFTLISQSPSHYISVLLHESVSSDKTISYPYNAILPGGVKFRQDTIVEIQNQKVIGQNASYEYDVLVVGLGFASDDFGIKGISEYSHAMVNATNCQAIHAQIRRVLQDGLKDSQELPFVICGGGFSGIELIASLAEELPQMCQAYGIDPKRVKLTCIEAMPKVLPMFPDALVQKGVQYLENLGVKFEVGAKILEVQENGVLVEQNGEQRIIESCFTFWSAGVKGNEVIAKSPFFTSGRSKVEVNTFLQPINQENQECMDNIFIIGDCAALKDPSSGRFYPPTAQMALQQGQYLAKVFPSKLEGLPLTQEFCYCSKGTICSLGSKYAIGLIGEKQIDGTLAIWAKRFTEWLWVVRLKGAFKALFA